MQDIRETCDSIDRKDNEAGCVDTPKAKEAQEGQDWTNRHVCMAL